MAGLFNKLFGMADEFLDPGSSLLRGTRARGEGATLFGEAAPIAEVRAERPQMFVSPNRAISAGLIDETPEDVKLARKMVESGKDTDEIAAMTGFHVDHKDNTIHAWLDDTDAVVRAAEANIGLQSGTYDTKMSKLLDHPTLFKYDPALGDYKVQFKDLGESVSAAHDGFRNTIMINTNPVARRFRSHEFTPDGIKASLIHELQHAVDNKRVEEGYDVIERAIETGSNMTEATVSALAEFRDLPRKAIDPATARQEVGQIFNDAKRGMVDMSVTILKTPSIMADIKKNYPAKTEKESMAAFLSQMADYPKLVDTYEKAALEAAKGDPLSRGSRRAAADLYKEQMDRLERIRSKLILRWPEMDTKMQAMYEARELGRRASLNYLGNPGEFRARLSAQLSTEGTPYPMRGKNYLKHGYAFETEAVEHALSVMSDSMSSRMLTRGKRKPIAFDPFQGQDDDPLASTVR